MHSFFTKESLAMGSLPVNESNWKSLNGEFVSIHRDREFMRKRWEANQSQKIRFAGPKHTEYHQFVCNQPDQLIHDVY